MIVRGTQRVLWICIVLLLLASCGIETLPTISEDAVSTRATVTPPPLRSMITAAPVVAGQPTALPVPVIPQGQAPRANATVAMQHVNCPDAAGPIEAPIVFGEGTGLMMVQADGQHVVPIVTEPENIWAHDPVWSPDGKTLAFTLSQPAVDPDLAWIQIGMICGLDQRTGKGRVLEQGTTPLESVEIGGWSANGQALLVTIHQPQLDAQKNYVSDSIALARYNLVAQRRETLLTDSMNPVLSPDANHLLFLRVDATTYATSLMLGGPAGQAAHALIPDSMGFASIIAPQWSPDGKSIVFTASGGTMGRMVRPAQHSWLDTLLGVHVAEAHGLPADLWLIGADGKGLRRLTDKGLDDPRAAWSPDGKQIAFSTGAAGGIWLMDLARLQMKQLTTQGHYGGIAWSWHSLG